MARRKRNAIRVRRLTTKELVQVLRRSDKARVTVWRSVVRGGWGRRGRNWRCGAVRCVLHLREVRVGDRRKDELVYKVARSVTWCWHRAYGPFYLTRAEAEAAARTEAIQECRETLQEARLALKEETQSIRFWCKKNGVRWSEVYGG